MIINKDLIRSYKKKEEEEENFEKDAFKILYRKSISL